MEVQAELGGQCGVTWAHNTILCFLQDEPFLPALHFSPKLIHNLMHNVESDTIGRDRAC